MRRAPITLGVRRPQPQPDMNQQITREIAEAAGFFGFPYYLVGMTEIL
jgi:hypothetical protein